MRHLNRERRWDRPLPSERRIRRLQWLIAALLFAAPFLTYAAWVMGEVLQELGP